MAPLVWIRRASTIKAVECGVLTTHMHCMKTLCVRKQFVFGAQCLENEIRGLYFFEETVLRKIIQIF